MKNFLEEFKKFIAKGNVLDMAVGVIIGGAFTAIVTSLNKDIITPILGIFGGVDFSNLFVKLGTGEKAPILTYGNFLTAAINFLITAFIVFCMIKGLNKLMSIAKKDEEKPEPTEKVCPYCQSKISIKATRCPHCTSILDESIEIK